MARTKISKQTALAISESTSGTALTFTACDAVNGNYVVLSGGEFLLAKGTGALTISSVPDGLGRAGDLSVTLAGEERIFGPFPIEGFRQAGGQLWFTGAAGVSVAWFSALR